MVAPLAGAWIEISCMIRSHVWTMSLPSRERGLKFIPSLRILNSRLSLPSRERGLKFNIPLPLGMGYDRRSPRGSVD